MISGSAKSYTVPDISKEPLFLNKTRSRQMQKESISFLGVPILLHGKSIGVLNVDRLFGDEIPFDEDIRLLSIIATLIAQFVSINRQVRLREAKLLKDLLARGEPDSHRRNSSWWEESVHACSAAAGGKGCSQQSLRAAPGRVRDGQEPDRENSARIQHQVNRAFCKDKLRLPARKPARVRVVRLRKRRIFGGCQPKPGRVEQAEGGSIFLDEVGELSLLLQSKLLRFLQEKEFERLGSTRTIKVDVRLMAATNKDLRLLVSEGKFREDLYLQAKRVSDLCSALKGAQRGHSRPAAPLPKQDIRGVRRKLGISTAALAPAEIRLAWQCAGRWKTSSSAW